MRKYLSKVLGAPDASTPLTWPKFGGTVGATATPLFIVCGPWQSEHVLLLGT